MGTHGLVEALEFDLRRLSSEARQTDGGFAGWATGLLGSGGKYGLVELRESAERSLLKVRSLASEDHETTVAELASSEEVMRTTMIACNYRGSRVVAVGIGFLQKLVAHGAVSRDSMPTVLQCLQHCADSNNEKVQLKSLQLLLTMLQSSLRPETEENVFIFMQVSAKLLTGSRCSESVQKTAESALRQVVGLVMFAAAEHEGIDEKHAGTGTKRMHHEAGASTAKQFIAVSPFAASRGGGVANGSEITADGRGGSAQILRDDETTEDDGDESSQQRWTSGTDAESRLASSLSASSSLHPCVRSAYRVVATLCAPLESVLRERSGRGGGNAAAATAGISLLWTSSGVAKKMQPAIPEHLALDLLETVLDTHPKLFIEVPALMNVVHLVVVPALKESLAIDSAGAVYTSDRHSSIDQSAVTRSDEEFPPVASSSISSSSSAPAQSVPSAGAAAAAVGGGGGGGSTITAGGPSASSSFEDFRRKRLFYRLTGSVMRGFMHTISDVVEMFFSALLRDLESAALGQKVLVLHVLRSFCENALLVEQCYAEFDWQRDRRSIITEMVDLIVRFIDAGLSNPTTYHVGDAMAAAGDSGVPTPLAASAATATTTTTSGASLGAVLTRTASMGSDISRSNSASALGPTLSGYLSVLPHAVDVEGMFLIADSFDRHDKGIDGPASFEAHHLQGSAAAASQMGVANAVTAAIECLVGIVDSIERLADVELARVRSDRSGEDGEHSSMIQSGERDAGRKGGTRSGNGHAEILVSVGDIARDIIGRQWKTILSSLQLLLSRFTSEAIVVRLLQSYHSFIRAAGHLRLLSCRDSFISSLCHFTLSKQEAPNASQPSDIRLSDGEQLVASSTAGTAAGGASAAGTQRRIERTSSELPVSRRASTRMLDDAGMLQPSTSGALSSSTSSLDMDGGGGVLQHQLLTLKNVQAFLTLFDVANELCESLESSWSLVVSTLDALDHTLKSPMMSSGEVTSSIQNGGIGGGGTTIGSSGTTTTVNGTVVLVGSAGGGSASVGQRQQHIPELAILSAAVTKLFSSTSTVHEKSLMYLYSALRCVSENSLPGKGNSSASPPSGSAALYALNHMVDIIERNTYRSNLLWPSLVEHILEILSRTSPPVRAAAVNALGRAMCAVIGYKKKKVPLSAASPDMRGNGRANGRSGSIGEDNGVGPVLELVALSPLAELYGSPVYPPDVRPASLQCLLYLLRQSGIAEKLDDGWGTFLRLLTEVAATPDQDVLALGFQSVQIIMNDYLSMVPFAMLKDSFFCLSAYIHQKTDLNTSLSALNLLWNAVDYLEGVVIHDKQQETGTTTTTSTTTSTTNGDAGAQSVPPAQVEALVLALFVALKSQCLDSRPEVRNTSVRALLTAILTHGSRLTVDGWRICFRDILLPLLPALTTTAQSSSTTECDGAILGVDKGQSVHMLVHHSRNSQMKQWDETLSIFIKEIARLLRTHLKVLFSIVRGFFLNEVYEKLLDFIQMLMFMRSKEVSVAAIGALQLILTVPAWDDKKVGHAHWRKGLDVFVDAALKQEERASASPPHEAADTSTKGASVTRTGEDVLVPALNAKSREEVVNALGSLLRGRTAQFVDDSDVDRILQGLDGIVRTCGCECSSSSGQYGPSTPSSELLPYPQRAFLETVVKVEGVGTANLAEVVNMLLMYVDEGMARPKDERNAFGGEGGDGGTIRSVPDHAEDGVDQPRYDVQLLSSRCMRALSKLLDTYRDRGARKESSDTNAYMLDATFSEAVEDILSTMCAVCDDVEGRDYSYFQNDAEALLASVVALCLEWNELAKKMPLEALAAAIESCVSVKHITLHLRGSPDVAQLKPVLSLLEKAADFLTAHPEVFLGSGAAFAQRIVSVIGLVAAQRLPTVDGSMDATHGGDGSACESVLVQTCTRRLFMFCDRLMSRTDAGQELSSFALPILLQRCTDILMVRY